MKLTFKPIFLLLVSFFIFCGAQNVYAATGDITGVRITSEGWYAEVDIEGFSTGGTLNYGFNEDANASTSDNDPSGAKVVFTVTSQGYDTNGTLGTITRTVYGTKSVRKPYPDNLIHNSIVMDEVSSGGTLTIKVALSEFIYVDDKNGGAGTSGTNPTVTIASGFYRDTGGGGTSNNAVSNFAVTNNSTTAYPKVIGRWAWPGYERLTTDFLVEAVAFHKFAKNGKPVAAVAFSAADQSGNVTRATSTEMTVSTRSGDANAVLVYAATLDIDALTQAQVLDVNFIAYPWVGDENSVLNSTVGADGYTQPDERLGPLHQINDKSGTYKVGYAIVDPINGNNSTGVTYLSEADAEAGYGTSTGNAYANIYSAALGLKTWHNINGSPTRNSAAGGIILLKEGNHAYPGSGSTSDLGTMNTWLIIKAATGAAQANTKISAGSITELKATRIKIEGITLSPSAAAGGLTGRTSTDVMWLHNNIINATTSAPIFAWRTLYGTQNTASTFTSGFNSYAAGQRAPWALVRGNTAAATTTAQFYNVIGNKNVTAANFIEYNDVEVAIGGMASSTNAIFAFNTIYGMSTAVVWASVSTSTGIAVVQNLFERWRGDIQGTLDISAGNDNGATTTNFIVWHNTMAGGRTQFAYNSGGSAKIPKMNYSVKYNIWLDQGTKSDTFTGAGGGNGNRTGNWPLVYSVGYFSEASLKNSFGGDFNGLFSKRQTSTDGNTFYLPGYVNDASAETGNNTGVNPDYRLASTSLLIDSATSTSDFFNVLPYDIAGNPRYANSDPGAYEYQPPYTMGTHAVATSTTVRVYGDEKWRTKVATTTAGTAALSVSLPGTDRTQWLDIKVSNWQNSGTRQKVWTETSSTTGLTNTVHVVGDLAASTNYEVSVDGVVGQNITGAGCTSGICTSDGSGQVTFTYTGTYSSHEFEVEQGSDSTAPTITNVTSDKANGSYTTGEVIDIDVTFSEAVTSSGNVTVTLETGTTDRTCTFSVSAATTGTCNYTVQAGDTSSDLTVASISGTIVDAATNAMTDFAPATNLAANKAIVIDTTAPTITNVSSDKANGSYKAGEIIDIDITFSEAVTSTGNVTVTLETGTTDQTCTFSVSNASSGSCNYTVQAGDTTSDLTVLSISGTIADAATNAMSNFVPATNLAANKALVIDTTAPTITNVSSDKTNGTYGVGEVIDIDVTFSENVTSTGNVTVTLETGTTDRTCTFSVSGASSGTCNYTVQAGDTTSDLTVGSISGTIADTATNAMSNFVPATNLAANKALVIDTTAPSRSNGSPTGTQPFGTASINLSLDTDEASTCKYSTSAATAYGSMTTFNTTGGTTHSSTIGSHTNGTSYTYYVKCQDAYANTNATDYSISFSIADDSTAPSVSMTAPTSGAKVSGASVALTATASDDDAVAGVQFKLNTNTLIGAEDTSPTYGVTWDSTAVVDGSHELIAVARDTTGNYATSSTVTVTVDNTTAPIISSGSPSSALAADTTSTSISVITDEAATCKYGTVASTAYASIASTFTSTGGTSHSATVSSLTNGSSYSYYVRCADGNGSANSSDYTISFSVNSSSGGGGGGGGGGSTGSSGSAAGGLPTYFANYTNLFPTVFSPVLTQTVTSLNTLYYGARNTDVKAIQVALNKKGYIIASKGGGSPGNETNFFGPATLAAVKKFQCSAMNICKGEFYGVLDAETLAILTDPNQKKSSLPRFTKSLSYEMISPEVKNLQIFLNSKGFLVAQTGTGSPGHENNRFGEATRKAVIRFQEEYASEILAPSGLKYGNGNFGPASIKKANALLGY